jgi:hypothetical protein
VYKKAQVNSQLFSTFEATAPLLRQKGLLGQKLTKLDFSGFWATLSGLWAEGGFWAKPKNIYFSEPAERLQEFIAYTEARQSSPSVNPKQLDELAIRDTP